MGCASSALLAGVAQGLGSGCGVNGQEVDMSHFKVVQFLGHGGFGIVQSAKKISNPDKTTYAMKSLKKEAILQRKGGIFAVLSELKVLSMLNHPFLCNGHYAFQDEYYLYLILDLCKGGDLRYNLMRTPHNRYPEAIVQFYAAQLILAVEYIHSQNILHRDIKPENILIGNDGYLKLTDFGISKVCHNIEDCQSSSGTHGYMAPELYQAPFRHGPSADWFALGVTVHELLFGKRPYDSVRLREAALVMDYSSLALVSAMTSPLITKECKSFLYEVLQPKASHRLGHRKGAFELRTHIWLQKVDFTAVLNKTIIPHSIPTHTITSCNSNRARDLLQKHFAPSVVTNQEVFARYTLQRTPDLASPLHVSTESPSKHKIVDPRGIVVQMANQRSTCQDQPGEESSASVLSQDEEYKLVKSVQKELKIAISDRKIIPGVFDISSPLPPVP